MKITLIIASLLLGLVMTGSARADRWDSKGWTKLGEREVNGKMDKDRIDVGRYEGKFSKLSIVVENSDLELLDLEVNFAAGKSFHPSARHVFKEGARSRVIDLPGDERVIKSIELKYKNLPGGGNAKVEVWAWKTDGGGGRRGK